MSQDYEARGYDLGSPEGNAAASYRDENKRLRAALEQLHSFVAVMVGRGPNATIPETVPTPLGIPVKVGEIMRAASAALTSHNREAE